MSPYSSYHIHLIRSHLTTDVLLTIVRAFSLIEEAERRVFEGEGHEREEKAGETRLSW